MQVEFHLAKLSNDMIECLWSSKHSHLRSSAEYSAQRDLFIRVIFLLIRYPFFKFYENNYYIFRSYMGQQFQKGVFEQPISLEWAKIWSLYLSPFCSLPIQSPILYPPYTLAPHHSSYIVSTTRFTLPSPFTLHPSPFPVSLIPHLPLYIFFQLLTHVHGQSFSQISPSTPSIILHYFIIPTSLTRILLTSSHIGTPILLYLVHTLTTLNLDHSLLSFSSYHLFILSSTPSTPSVLFLSHSFTPAYTYTHSSLLFLLSRLIFSTYHHSILSSPTPILLFSTSLQGLFSNYVMGYWPSSAPSLFKPFKRNKFKQNVCRLSHIELLCNVNTASYLTYTPSSSFTSLHIPLVTYCFPLTPLHSLFFCELQLISLI